MSLGSYLLEYNCIKITVKAFKKGARDVKSSNSHNCATI